MSLLVTGSIGIDTVKTPFGKSRDCIGGSAVYFSLAASFFSAVRLVGVIGDDCPFDLGEVFKDRGVDLQGLVQLCQGCVNTAILVKLKCPVGPYLGLCPLA